MTVYLWCVTVVRVVAQMDGTRNVIAKTETFFSENQKNTFIELCKTMPVEGQVNWNFKAYTIDINLGGEV